MTTTIKGKISRFGGPADTGMKPAEGVALYTPRSRDVYSLFLPGRIGYGRGLDPKAFYCAMRWDYDKCGPSELRGVLIGVRRVNDDQFTWMHPVDYGPGMQTGRVIDVSPAALRLIGAVTDDTVVVAWNQGSRPLPILG